MLLGLPLGGGSISRGGGGNEECIDLERISSERNTRGGRESSL